MVAHALNILVNELNRHLTAYDLPDAADTGSNRAVLGNMAEGFASGGNAGGVARNKLLLSVVNIREEKTLKNQPNTVRNDARLSVTYQNPPLFLNFQLLLTATHTDYTAALLMLSRGLQFFQYRNTFTPDTVAPESLLPPASIGHPLDQLAQFRLRLELHSPTMEEINHLWGTLGGKQYPFALYTLRMLDLQFRATQGEGGLITEVVQDFYHKQPVN